jgi:hypothetical protein
LKQLTDFYEIWEESFAIGGYHKAMPSTSLKSVLATWWMRGFVGRETP